MKSGAQLWIGAFMPLVREMDAKDDFEFAIDEALTQGGELNILAKQFLDVRYPCKRYLLGRNDDALKLVSRITIDGVIDDFSGEAEWQGIPLVKAGEIRDEAVIVNCSTSVSPISAQKKLEQLSSSTIIWFCHVAEASAGAVARSEFVTDMRESYQKQTTKWNWLMAQMSDAESARLLREIILFRLTGNPRFMQRHTVRLKEQYFEPFLGGDIQNFVDVGGFDGDTTEQFVGRYPGYQSVLFFEPSKANLEKAKTRLAQVKNIQYFPMGASDESATLRFSGTLGSASTIDEKGTDTIEVCRLDDIIKDKVDWIKMDIEGWEFNAIQGCIETIKRFRPILSIAVYHHANDFLRIPELIEALNPGYRIYLRHYTEGWSETIMYFIPKKLN